MFQVSDEKKQSLDMIIDCYYRFYHVSDIIYKCRLFVKFLKTTRIF